ncbi:ribonuclease H-like domain-containing protein [Tanacetum coccineum]
MVNCNPSRTNGDPVFDLNCIRGTLNYGLQLFSSSTIDLFAYSDADWAGFPTTRRPTSGAEAEYRGVANAIAETCWIRNLLRELHSLLSSATLVRVLHVLSHYQFADIFTKGLPLALFEEFQSSLSIWLKPKSRTIYVCVYLGSIMISVFIANHRMVEPKAATKLVGATGLVISTMAVASSSTRDLWDLCFSAKRKEGELAVRLLGGSKRVLSV